MTNTLSLSTYWLWELFPYNNEYPTPGEFGSSTPGAPNVATVPSDSLSIIADTLNTVGAQLGVASAAQAAFNAGQLAVSGPGEIATMGLRSFSMSRSKGSADGSANLSVVGTPPKNAYPGVWCCLTTVSPGNNKKRVRFIGQITSVSYAYQINDKGTGTIVTSYNVREWSQVLKVPVRVESQTISQALLEPTPVNSANFASNKIGEKKWVDVLNSSYNPFDTAALILQLIGALSSDNSKNQIVELANLNYYETAGRMPIIPPALIKRLGIDCNNTNPFASGFVQIINGIRNDVDPRLSDGTWSGLFGDDAISIHDYQNSYTTENTGRPVGSNIAALMSINEPAWSLLTQYCDPAHNEFFTDILYEIDEFGNEITQPVFIFRDQPFLLSTIDQSIPTDLSKFSLFDTLPTVGIDDRSIMGFTFSNTILNSPNLIRVQWTDTFQDATLQKAAAASKGYSLLLPEMLRFGGNEFETTTNFVNLNPSDTSDPGYNTADWWAQIRDVVTAWHAYNYRMGNGQLNMKDYNAPISIGNNVQFDIGNFTLVGHVDAISFSVMVDEKGLIQNTMQLTLSRIVQKNDNGDLIFISPTQFGALSNPETVPKDPGSVDFPNLPEVADLINNAGNAISGVFK